MILSFLVALLFQLAPAVVWEAKVEQGDGDKCRLVVTGKVADGYFMHPMADKAVGVSLELAENLTPVGTPAEEFAPAEYKGVEIGRAHV